MPGRYGTALSVIMIDVDNFKKINDVYGHHAGDAVLKDICTLLPSLVRKSDYLARETRLSDKSTRVTASIGVASLENKPDGGSLFREADGRLYKAKAIGKNCVVPDLLPCFADRTFMSKDRAHKYANTVRGA